MSAFVLFYSRQPMPVIVQIRHCPRLTLSRITSRPLTHLIPQMPSRMLSISYASPPSRTMNTFRMELSPSNIKRTTSVVTEHDTSNQVYNIQYNDDTYYFGQINGQMRHGMGALYNKQKKLIYEGEWKDDKFHGIGILYTLNSKYRGHFENGLFNGLGIEESGGRKFVGKFKDGLRDGCGTMYEGKHTVEGFWKGGQLQSRVSQ